jgi:hypothetical protein
MKLKTFVIDVFSNRSVYYGLIGFEGNFMLFIQKELMKNHSTRASVKFQPCFLSEVRFYHTGKGET